MVPFNHLTELLSSHFRTSDSHTEMESSSMPTAVPAASTLPTSKGVHVSVNVQYKPLPNATVGSVMHVFETPYWANFMIQYIVPYLKSYKPTSQHILEKLAEWKVASPCVDEYGCAICMSDMDAADSVGLPCGHVFHSDCVRQWLTRRNTCPNCRHEFQKELAGRFVVSTIKTSLQVDQGDVHSPGVRDTPVGGHTMHAVVNMTLFQVHDEANYGCDLFVELQQASTKDDNVPPPTPSSPTPSASSTQSTSSRSKTSRKRSDRPSKMEAARILKRLRTDP
ncbi:Aste57867_23958 [Aphanomyces stellatus]|uniref:Aste57867_23958 protein n=1 Tax=Aphanomyces stellatus TaxID=120398 RepID=A0A485LP65_9STRA|nr:hypothetical protein As57867_023885 [Aphanomyces stellatus]VFU00601.1 Aste57867_23958 [Aphanomyces stellatus]